MGSLVVAHRLKSMWVLVIVAFGLFNCGTQAPERVGLVAVVCRLGCSVACGVLVP